MAISLTKGSSFNLSKKEPALKKVMIGLGWDMKTDNKLDLDASVFLVNGSGKLPSDTFFIFYNNLKSPDGSVQHTGDNRTGDGDSDDEMILVNLSLIDSRIDEIIVIVTIHDAAGRRHNFGHLRDAYIRVMDVETKREILRYDLDADNPKDTDMEFGRLQRINGDWNFLASGIGSTKGLEGYVNAYA